MEIDTKKFTTMIIGFVVAVVLVSGIMVPVISDVTSDSSSGYTNTGEYYYKSPVEGENHTIEVTEDDNYVYATYDGQNVVTKEKGNEGWCIPLLITSRTTLQGDMYFMYAITNYVEWLEPFTGIYIAPLDGDGFSADSIPCTYNLDGSAIIQDSVTLRDVVTYHIATEGEMVLTKSPVVNKNQIIYGMQIFSTIDLDSDPMIDRNVGVFGIGTIEELNHGKTYREISQGIYGNGILTSMDICRWTLYNKSDSTYIGEYYPKTLDEWGEGDIVVNATDISEDTARLNGIDLKIPWERYDDATDVVIEEVTFDTFIVPVEIESTEEGSELSLVLMSLISVIPLITVVGIVIGSVGFLRLKDQ